MRAAKAPASLRIYDHEEGNTRNPYNQITHLTQNTIRESDKNTRKRHIQESQEVSPFPTGDHKASRNRQDSMTGNTNNKMIQKRSTALNGQYENYWRA